MSLVLLNVAVQIAKVSRNQSGFFFSVGPKMEEEARLAFPYTSGEYDISTAQQVPRA